MYAVEMQEPSDPSSQAQESRSDVPPNDNFEQIAQEELERFRETFTELAK